LIEAGAQIHVTDAEKQTPLQLCQQLKENDWVHAIPMLQPQVPL